MFVAFIMKHENGEALLSLSVINVEKNMLLYRALPASVAHNTSSRRAISRRATLAAHSLFLLLFPRPFIPTA